MSSLNKYVKMDLIYQLFVKMLLNIFVKTVILSFVTKNAERIQIFYENAKKEKQRSKT